MPRTRKEEKAETQKEQQQPQEKPEPKQEKPEQKKEQPKDERQELIDTLQRLQAEFENYKKRIDRDYDSMIKCSNEDLIKHLLPIIDNFELALKSCREKDDFYRGMELIYSQLMDTLHSQGIKHIECIGKKFDPYYHEVLLAEENEKEANTIIDELQKGYMLYNKVIRHSKVKIAKKKKEEVKSPAGN
ncbi:nucleotide exchange factor GrpE [Candidatus Woesearchaeota archaeon]|nr:nucleotide exchange factor GrpE [Candidatus Woesearchaeota archaeon]